MVMSKNMFFLLAAVLTSTFLPLNAQSDSARSQLEALVHSIEANDIVSVEIFGVPEDAVFAVNISPESLENAWDYKVTLRSPSALQSRVLALTTALRRAGVQPAAKKVEFLDVRTGVAFYSKAENVRRIAVLYFDRAGRAGAVGNAPVFFGPEFLPSLRKALHFSVQ